MIFLATGTQIIWATFSTNRILEWLGKYFNFKIQKIVKVQVEKATTASKWFKIQLTMATRRNSRDLWQIYGTLVTR